MNDLSAVRTYIFMTSRHQYSNLLRRMSVTVPWDNSSCSGSVRNYPSALRVLYLTCRLSNTKERSNATTLNILKHIYARLVDFWIMCFSSHFSSHDSATKVLLQIN